jgi:hypothetical protein
MLNMETSATAKQAPAKSLGFSTGRRPDVSLTRPSSPEADGGPDTTSIHFVLIRPCFFKKQPSCPTCRFSDRQIRIADSKLGNTVSHSHIDGH